MLHLLPPPARLPDGCWLCRPAARADGLGDGLGVGVGGGGQTTSGRTARPSRGQSGGSGLVEISGIAPPIISCICAGEGRAAREALRSR